MDKEKIFIATAAFLNTRAAQISFEQTSQKKTKESAGQTQAVIEAMKITAAGLMTQTMDAKLWTATLTNTPSPTISNTPTNTATMTNTPSPTITSTPPLEIGSQKVREKDGMVMVYVPEGDFIMGGPDVGWNNEKPFHWVFLDAFWIDLTEVTNAKYAKCVAEGFCTKPYLDSSSTRSKYFSDNQYDNFPVNYVDWYQAKTYCIWAGGDLPTEAQWEKAAKGTDDLRNYPWGNYLDKHKANYRIDKNGDTKKVGSYPEGASPYGILDMAGNVDEWVNDWYDENYYSVSPYQNPTGPYSGEYHVIRGGNYDDSFPRINVRFRRFKYPDYYSKYTGFRCVFQS